MPRAKAVFDVALFAVLASALFASRLEGAVLTVDPGVSTFLKRDVFHTIQQAADHARPGDTVVIHGGVYRETVTVTKSGKEGMPIRFQPEAGAKVIICGSDPVTQCSEEPKFGPNAYSFPWPYVFIDGPHECHPEDLADYLTGRCEQFFINDHLQRQVLTLRELADGTFCVDRPSGKIFFRLIPGASPKNSGLEVSTRQLLWQSSGSYIEVRGLIFQNAANMAQEGAVRLMGDHCSLLGCVIYRTNSAGAAFLGRYDSAAGCVFQDNGQEGFTAGRAHGLRITGCLIAHNNLKGFSRGWECGGCKIVLSRNVVVSGCTVCDNFGPGLWFDIGNEACTVKNCFITRNTDAGLFYEISYGLLATDNVIIVNGFDFIQSAWGARSGITISSSPGCTVKRNILYGNNEGFNFREQIRTTSRIDSKPAGMKEEIVYIHDELIEKNIISGNFDAEVWGWFDVRDQRYLPYALWKPPCTDYRDPELRDLHIRMKENVFATNQREPFYHWGAPWQVSYAYSDLATLRHQLGLEKGSILTALPFKDPAKPDFSLPQGSPAFDMDAYPKGSVPGVILGAY